MINNIYLDNAATTKPYPEVADLMCEILKTNYGNSSSAHYMGVEAYRIIKDSTNKIADIIGCDPTEIVFTSGGTESNNMALKGYAYANSGRGKGIITTKYEHASVGNTFENLKKFGFNPLYLNIGKDKSADISELEKLITKETILVSTMMVNSETGAITDIRAASDIIKNLNMKCAYHVDAVQGFCKFDICMHNLKKVDMMSFSSHKIRGPKGMGALYIKKGTNIESIINGGGHQHGFRSGTENTPGVAGFALACELTYKKMKQNIIKVSQLKDYLINTLAENISDYLINSPDNASPYIFSVSFKDVKGEVLMNYLSSKGICVSSGSACSSKKDVHSHVLEAMDVPLEYIEGSLRFSFNADNTSDEIDILVNEIKNILPILRNTRRK